MLFNSSSRASSAARKSGGSIRKMTEAVATVVENLESRRLFSSAALVSEANLGVAPQVSGVYVQGTNWTNAFKSYLEAHSMGDAQLGYGLGNGVVPQLDPLPWTNLNQINIRFDQDVTVAAGDLKVESALGAAYNISSFAYNAAIHTGVWTLASALSIADRLTLKLDNVTGTSTGAPLDGDFNDTPGGQFLLQANVVPGDVNRDGQVTATDLVLERNRVGRTTQQPGTGNSAYTPFSDVNGDGSIAAADLVLVRNRVGRVLPGIRFGQVVNGEIPLVGDERTFLFDATASGPVVLFDSLDQVPTGLTARIVSPTGQVISQFGASGDSAAIVLPGAGTYKLVVSGGESVTGAFSFRLLDLATSSTALPLNTFVNGQLAQGVQTAVYRFTGSTGQQIYVDINGTNASSDIYDAQGNLVGSFFGNNSGPTPLLSTGTFFLVVRGVSQDNQTIPFTARVLDAATAPLISFGQIFTGTPTPSRDSSVFRLALSAGQDVLFDALDASTPGSWGLQNSRTETIASNGAASDFNAHINETGEYFLVINAVDKFSFRVLDPAQQSTPIAIGGPVTAGSITPDNGAMVFRFNAVAGQRLYIDDQAGSTNVNETVFAAGTQTNLQSFGNGVDGAPVTIPVTGVYYLVASGYASEGLSQSYAFRLIDASASTAVTVNDVVSGTLTPGTQSVTYRFSGTAGQHLYFDNLSVPDDTDGSSRWSLYAINNSVLDSAQLANNFADSADFDVTLPATGEYVLALAGGRLVRPFDYSFRILDYTRQSSPLTLDTAISVTLDSPNASKIYSFNGSPGQTLLLEKLGDDNNGQRVQIIGPDGVPIANQGNLIRLGQAGTFYVVVSSRAGQSASVGFRLIDAANALQLPIGGNLSGSLNPGQKAVIYRFAGQSGDQLNFDAIGSDAGGNVRLYAPNGDNPIAVNFVNDFNYVLTQTGEYLVVLESSNPNAAATYSFDISIDPVAPIQASGFGEVHTVTLDPGAQQTFTFDVPAGTPFYLDSLTPVDFSSAYEIFGPNGLIASTYLGDFGPTAFTAPGTYSVKISQSGGTATTSSFRLLNLRDSATVAINQTVSSTATPGQMANAYQIGLTAGQRIYLESLDGSSLQYSFISPDGLNLGNDLGQPDSSPKTITRTGTYYILVNSFAGSDPASFGFRILDVSAQPEAVVGAERTGTLDSTNATDVFRFNAVAGQKLLFDNLTPPDGNDGSSRWDLFDARNTLVAGGYLGRGDDFGYTPLESGQFVLVLNRSQAVTQLNYDFRILDFNAASTPLALGQDVTDTLTPGSSSRIYEFDLPGGHAVLLDVLTQSGFNVGYELHMPDGTSQLLSFFGQDDGILTPLAESGRYYLVVRGLPADPVNYGFRLLDASAQPSHTIGSTTTGTLEPGSGAMIYQFQAAAGQQIMFDSLSAQSDSDGGSAWSVVSANGQVLANAALFYRFADNDLRFTAPSTGTYYLVLQGRDVTATDRGFTFRSFDVNAEGRPLPLGIVQSGVADPGTQSIIYKFQATAGQKLFLDVLNTDTTGVDYAFQRPDGVVISNGADDRGPIIITQAGAYYLRVAGHSDTPVPYTFTLTDLASAPQIALGQEVAGTLNPGNSVAAFRINLIAGQHIRFDSLSTDSGGFWRLARPNGDFIGFNQLDGDFEIDVASSGEYLLVLQGTNTQSPVSYDFRAIKT